MTRYTKRLLRYAVVAFGCIPIILYGTIVIILSLLGVTVEESYDLSEIEKQVDKLCAKSM